MMKKLFGMCLILFLTACGSDDDAKVSRHGDFTPSGMTYDQFRIRADARAKDAGGDEWEQRRNESAAGNAALHKRFMALDRNNDGHLSEAEAGGY